MALSPPWRFCAASLFFHRLGERDLWSSHEARAAMDAQSLLDADSSGLPRLYDGRLDLQKPPLYYWLVAGVARLRGVPVDALAVRLPSALAAALTVLAVGLGVGVGFGRPVAGLLAGLVLATGIHFPWLARIGRIDMPLTFTVTLAAGGFALALRPRRALLPRIRLSRSCRLTSPAQQACCSRGPSVWRCPARSWRPICCSTDAGPPSGSGAPGVRLLHELGVWWGLPLVLLLVVPVFLWADHVSGGAVRRGILLASQRPARLGGWRLRSHPWYLYAPLFPPLLPALQSRCSPTGPGAARLARRSAGPARAGVAAGGAAAAVLCASSSAPTISCRPTRGRGVPRLRAGAATAAAGWVLAGVLGVAAVDGRRLAVPAALGLPQRGGVSRLSPVRRRGSPPAPRALAGRLLPHRGARPGVPGGTTARRDRRMA